MVISEQDAIEQLRPLIGSLIVEMPYGWDPFNSEADDRFVYDWVKHEDNGWCSGKKEDFELFLQMKTGYDDGDYARAALKVFGITIR